jgi:polygalacturonase
MAVFALAGVSALGCSKESSCATPTVEAAQGMHLVSTKDGDGVCDGSVYPGDHAAAIQACVDHASAEGGGIVLVQAGTYSTGQWALTLKRKVTLQGEGELAATLAPATSVDVIAVMEDDATVANLVFDLAHLGSDKSALRFGPGTAHTNVRIEGNTFLGAQPPG